MPTNNANYIGKAAYWGVGTGTSVAGTGVATMLIQSAEFTPAATRADIMDEKGGTVGVAFANAVNRLSIEGLVTGTTLADAKAQAASTPPPGTVVTVDDDDDTEIVGEHSGKWFVVEATKRKVNSDMVRMTLQLEQVVATDVTTAVTAGS